MNQSNNLFSNYKEMLKVSHGMLAAANEENWDRLIDLEMQRSGIVQKLQDSGNLVPDDQKERESLISLIKEIQSCDEVVRPKIVAWMSELKGMFESLGNEVKLGKQYGRN